MVFWLNLKKNLAVHKCSMLKLGPVLPPVNWRSPNEFIEQEEESFVLKID